MCVTIAWLLTAFNSQFHKFFHAKGVNNIVSDPKYKRWWKLSWWILIHLRSWQGFTETGTLIAYTTHVVQLAHMSSQWPFKECFKCQCSFRKHWTKYGTHWEISISPVKAQRDTFSISSSFSLTYQCNLIKYKISRYKHLDVDGSCFLDWVLVLEQSSKMQNVAKSLWSDLSNKEALKINT